jgi:excinuclease UvrABC nuclease subunit
MKAVKTKFVAPYKAKGERLVPNLEILKSNKEAAGAYMIKSNRTGKIVYVGYSQSQLYKTVYRHFQKWNDRRAERKVYSPHYYTVRVIITTQSRAFLLEKYLIQKLKPRDNQEKYENYLFASQKKDAEKILNDTDFISISEDRVPF